MNIQSIINKLKLGRKPKSEDEIKKEIEQKKEIAIIKAIRLKQLIKEKDTGWKEFCELIEDYINSCMYYKLKTPLDTANQEVLEQLKYQDRDIYILKWVLQIPQQFINKTEKKEGEN